MSTPIQRAALFALYQLSVLFGIALLPVALLLKRTGVTVPVHRLVESIERAYEHHA